MKCIRDVVKVDIGIKYGLIHLIYHNFVIPVVTTTSHMQTFKPCTSLPAACLQLACSLPAACLQLACSLPAAGLTNVVAALPVVKVVQLRFAARQLICFKVYQMLPLQGPMQGRRVWVAVAEPGVSCRSQPWLPGATREAGLAPGKEDRRKSFWGLIIY